MLLCYMLSTIVALLPTLPKTSGDGWAEEPCSPDVYRRLPNLKSRYDYYETHPLSVNQDSGLTTGWYYTENMTMLDHPPHNNWACGSKYPIWQYGTINLVVNESITVTACYFGFHKDCEETFFVSVKLCPGMFYVYGLVPTRSSSAYCFGDGKEGIGPTFAPGIGLVEYNTHRLVDDTARAPNNFYTEVYFTCTFVPSKTEDLWYRVYWYQNDYVLYTTNFGKTVDSIDFQLTEPLFVENGFSLGNEISCVAQAFNEVEGPPGPHSDRSNSLYVGIQVMTPELNFEFGDTNEAKRTIRLKRTIPVGCNHTDTCKVELLARIPDGSDENQCSIIKLEGRRCGIEINSDDVLGEEIKILVTPAGTGQYIESEVYREVHLKVDVTDENRIWDNHALEPIKVTMTSPERVKLSYGARCDANNDPHMWTFDRENYELQRYYGHVEGVYTLYYNDRFKTVVQIQVARCTHTSRAFCNCGVAALAGQDVFYIDYCNGADGIPVDYKSCGDNVLEVKSITELKYEIYFPYGTYVQVDIQKIYGGIFLGVHVQPSIYDSGTTSGLCGSLDGNKGNDFTDKNGMIVTRDQFLESWRLSSQEASKNMFDRTFNLTSLTPMETNVCICNIDQTGRHPIRDELSCNKSAVATCRKGKDTGKDMCPNIQGRKRRSVERNPKKPKVTVKPLPFRFKANCCLAHRGSTDDRLFQWGCMKDKGSPSVMQHVESRQTVTWTRENAEKFCTDYMKGYPVYSACEQVQNARPEGAIYDCVEDIMLSGGTDWAQISQETMRSTCTSEFSRNVSLWISEYNTPSIAETIERMACINDCSQQGLCNEGECECYDPYVGSDCSVDKQAPPEMHGLLDDGLCDERDMPCTDAHFFAHPLIDSSTLTCHLSKYKIYLSGFREHISNHTVAAEFRTITEGLCPLETIYENRDSVYLYTVAVSYDRVHASNEENLYIFDSTCQVAEEVDGEVYFSLMGQFCFIEGECIANEQLSMLDNCSICNTTLSLESWSSNVNEADCVSTSANPVFTSPIEVTSVPFTQSTDSESGLYNQTTPKKSTSSSIPSKSSTQTKITSTGSTATITKSATIDSIMTIITNKTTQKASSTREASITTHNDVTRTGISTQRSTSGITVATNTTPSVLEHTSSTVSVKTINNYTQTAEATTTITSPSTRSYTTFKTPENLTSSKDDHDTSTSATTQSRKTISDTTSPDVLETKPQTSSSFQEHTSNARPSENAVISTQSMISPESTASSTDASPSTQTENNLWIIGAVVPSIIVLAMIIVVGTLVYMKNSNRQTRIQSTTNVQSNESTRLPRRNTSTSLTALSAKLVDYGDYLTPSNYHPPPKPDVSFEESRKITQDTSDDSFPEDLPNIFRHFYVSEPPSATRLQNELTFERH